MAYSAPPTLPLRRTNDDPSPKQGNPGGEQLHAAYKARREKALETLKANGLMKHLATRVDLSGKQRAFVIEYLADPDKSCKNAAIRAGYSMASANYAWDNIYWHPKIKAVIDKYEAGLLEKALITKQRVLNSLAEIAFANTTDYMTVRDDGSVELNIEKIRANPNNAIQEIATEFDFKTGKQKVRIRMYDKLTALNMLAKYLKMFEEPVQNTFLTVNFLDKLVKGQASVAELAEATQVFDAAPELPEREVSS